MTDSALPPANFAVPAEAQVQQTGGRGSFVSKVQWEHPDGSTATWESRRARKRGFIEVLRDGVVQRIRTRPAHAIRLGRCNTVSGISFFLGGGLFTLGAVLSQLDAATPSTISRRLAFLDLGSSDMSDTAREMTRRRRLSRRNITARARGATSKLSRGHLRRYSPDDQARTLVRRGR